MDKVYLLETEAMDTANFGASMTYIGASMRECACVLPWCLTASIVFRPASVRCCPSGHTRVVVAEITGNYIAIQTHLPHLANPPRNFVVVRRFCECWLIY